MKGTVFSADFVADSDGNLRLLELNTDTGFIEQEIDNFDFDDFLFVLSSNTISTLDIIFKPYIHQNFVDSLSNKIREKLPSVININLHDENINSIYPNNVTDTGDNFILRLAYDESAIFDSFYCKNRLNTYNLFTENSILDYSVAHYHKSNSGVVDTLTREINISNVPDLTIKDINESFNPIDFFKLNVTGTTEEAWNKFISENEGEDKIIEQYHFNPSYVDQNGHITSVRFFGLVYGPQLDLITLHSYRISSVFELPTTIDLDNTNNKVKDHHYYELTTNFLKNDSGGILSSHELLMDDNSWRSIKDIEVGDGIQSYFIEGRPDTDSDVEALTWNYDGNELPTGSYMTTSNVIYRQVENLRYGGVMEIVVDSDSLFSGLNKKYLVFDSLTNKSSFKFVSAMNSQSDYLYDLDGNLVQIDELNFYITKESELEFVELDVEESDTYIINGSTAFNGLVSHNSPCFIEGTKILMDGDEIKNIEDVVVGDKILSFDFASNQIKQSTVQNIFSKKVKTIVHYDFSDGGSLAATLDHPIYIIGKGWCSFSSELSNSMYKLDSPVKTIELGDIVKFKDREETLVSYKIIESENSVYNLSDVTPFNNYYANNVLVHNRGIFLCFVPGTKITMGDRTEKNIEDILVGDEVMSFNEEKKVVERKKVTKLSSPIHDDLVKYTLSNGTEITSTYDHPYYVNGLQLASYKPKWTNERYNLPTVVEIKVGDLVNLLDGNTVQIKMIEELERIDTQTYIFSVEDNRNFFANGVLVHNK